MGGELSKLVSKDVGWLGSDVGCVWVGGAGPLDFFNGGLAQGLLCVAFAYGALWGLDDDGRTYVRAEEREEEEGPGGQQVERAIQEALAQDLG